jgi:type I restriction enzyme S subunit
MMDLPAKWRIARLDSLAEVQPGLAKNSRLKGATRSLPYMRVANVQDGHLDLRTVKTITATEEQIRRHSLKIGDVLVTEGGDFDKLGRGYIWSGQIEPCLHQNHVFVIRFDQDKFLPELFAYLTSSSYGRLYFLRCSKRSTNLASINSAQLKAFPVPVPPISEQRKIAELLGLYDEAIELQKRLVASFEQQKKSLLQVLLTGKMRVKV